MWWGRGGQRPPVNMTVGRKPKEIMMFFLKADTKIGKGGKNEKRANMS